MKYFILILIVLCGCRNKYLYHEINEFHLDQKALINHDLVKVIYFSGGPDFNEKSDYYYQYIVVSQSTNDTVRVLAKSIYQLKEDELLNFFSILSKDGTDLLILTADENTEALKKVKNTHSLKTSDIKMLKRVVADRTNEVDPKRFPTVIGALGTTN